MFPCGLRGESQCLHGLNRSLNLIIDAVSHVRAAPPVDKIDSHSLTQVREYLDGEVRAAGRDEGGEEVPPAEADHQARAEVGDLQ